MKTQLQHFYSESEKTARINDTFMRLIKDGLTQNELKQLIRKRPSIYGRFSNWLEKLPNS